MKSLFLPFRDARCHSILSLILGKMFPSLALFGLFVSCSSHNLVNLLLSDMTVSKSVLFPFVEITPSD